MRRLAMALFIAPTETEPESENYAEPDMFMVSNPYVENPKKKKKLFNWWRCSAGYRRR